MSYPLKLNLFLESEEKKQNGKEKSENKKNGKEKNENEENQENEEKQKQKQIKINRPLEEIQSEETLWTYTGLRPYARKSFPQNFPKNSTNESQPKIIEKIIQDFLCAIADELNEYRWHDIDEMLFHLCLVYSVWPDYLDHKEYPKCCWINNMPPYWNKWIERGDIILFKVCSKVHRIKI
jgi:hypothetical protein